MSKRVDTVLEDREIRSAHAAAIDSLLGVLFVVAIFLQQDLLARPTGADARLLTTSCLQPRASAWENINFGSPN